ncbi:MAG: TlpA family protein disulfide reductase [Roseovarius sp.]|uniref:TlpA family protein disulfide reductase n=1 Tax=Thalassococcus profundi TaxID=2282382 RepID=UPI00405A0F8C
MRRILFILAILFPAVPAIAHHPGERIDEVMAEREPAFEPTDQQRTPRLRGIDADGGALRLDAMQDRIVVVSFAPEGCGAPCDTQQALLRKVQEGVNITPMLDWIIFLTVGPATGADWDRANWFAITPEGDAVKTRANFSALSDRNGSTPMVHIIDRGGRHAAIFHGTEFGHVNLILYLSELANTPPPEPGLLDRIFGIFQ